MSVCMYACSTSAFCPFRIVFMYVCKASVYERCACFNMHICTHVCVYVSY